MPSFPQPPRTWTAGDEVTAALLNAQLRDALLAIFPVGAFHYFMQAGTSVETTINGAFLECNGVAVSRTTYANLNTAMSGLSYPFGSGDGSTTFNLPDCRGRILIHNAASGHADVNNLGDNDGVTLASRTPHHSTTGLTHTHAAGSYVTPSTNLYNAAATPTTSTGGAIAVSIGAGAITGTSGSASPTGGPGGSTPNDLVPWVVAGIYAIRY